MLKWIIAIAIASAPAAVLAAKPAVAWTTYADCAAGYRANSQIADPSSPSSMVAMVADQSNDYAKAAIKSYRAQANVSDGEAKAAVKAYISAQTPALAGRTRDKLDAFLDTCPVIDD